MSQNNNSAKIYTNTPKGEYTLSLSNTKKAIALTNNKAQQYAELAEKYKNEAKEYRDNAKYYSEQNSDVTYEHINNIKTELIAQIQTKQNLGNYALKEELPTKVSELNNDLNYTTFNEVIPQQEGNEHKVLCTDGENLYWETKSSYSLFDTRITDHVLSFEESTGWALQGTFVYKNAVAGTYYGYPDFYNKVLEEYNEATTTETVNGVTVKVHSNGHRFYDIANKPAIDSFFNTIGSAWFYGVDTANERIFLPRNNYFEQVTDTISEVGESIQAGLPNITGRYKDISYIDYSGTGTFNRESFYATSALPSGNNIGQGEWLFDASCSNTIYGKSNTVQPNAVKKLLYICVGNTTNFEGVTDVINQSMEIINQVNLGIESRVNLDATNLSGEGKSLISGYAMPSASKKITLTLGANGTVYTAPANGWVCYISLPTTGVQYCRLICNSYTNYRQSCYSALSGQYIEVILPVLRGQQFTIYQNAPAERFEFIYAQGEV